MNILTVGLIVGAGWVSLLIAVVAICKAAAFGDVEGAGAYATESVRLAPPATATERPRRFKQPALS